MIPVLGVPILTGPEMLDEMLASIDQPVGEIVVIDNGNVVGELNATVIKPGFNLGVAASWNRIIAERPSAPWWAIVGYDVILAPGDLARLTNHMVSTGGLALLGGFNAFGLDHVALDRAGTFDENFHPAYFEDNDYDRRCQLVGVPLAALPSGLLHRTSSTISNNRTYSRENARTFPYNALYYKSKWGGPPRQERYETPFNEGGSVADWKLDPERLATQRWDQA